MPKTMDEPALFPVERPIAAGAVIDKVQAWSRRTLPWLGAHPALTSSNRDLIHDFVTILYERREPRIAFEKYVDEGYIQHNPAIADGRESALRWLEPVFAKPDAEIQVRRVTVDGNYATVQIIGRMGPDDPGSAIINIFRLEDGMIMEHWDVIQAMPAKTVSGRPLV